MSVDKSERKSKRDNLIPFGKGKDVRRGRGPAKGAPNAGRPPEWLKLEMAKGREKAVEKLVKRLDAKNPLEALDNDQMLKLVEKWAPDDERGVGAKVVVSPDGTVTLNLGRAE